jgi:hypothetical protein
VGSGSDPPEGGWHRCLDHRDRHAQSHRCSAHYSRDAWPGYRLERGDKTIWAFRDLHDLCHRLSAGGRFLKGIAAMDRQVERNQIKRPLTATDVRTAHTNHQPRSSRPWKVLTSLKAIWNGWKKPIAGVYGTLACYTIAMRPCHSAMSIRTLHATAVLRPRRVRHQGVQSARHVGRPCPCQYGNNSSGAQSRYPTRGRLPHRARYPPRQRSTHGTDDASQAHQ